MADDGLMIYVHIKISPLKVLVFVVHMAIVKEVIRFMPYLFLRKTHIFMVIYHGMIIFHGGSMFVDFVGYPYPQIMSIKEMN